MVLDLKGLPTNTPDDHSQSSLSGLPYEDRLAVEKALQELHHALLSKKVENICSAYQGLRKGIHGMPIKSAFQLIDSVAGSAAGPAIVAAFARRPCFMCTSGTVPCDPCGGSGRTPAGQPCPHCDSFGIMPCGFCRGTAWADRETIPPELARAVLQRQVAALREETARLDKKTGRIEPSMFAGMPRDQRHQLALGLMKLHARLGELRAMPHLLSEQILTDFEAAMVHLDKLLSALAGAEAE